MSVDLKAGVLEHDGVTPRYTSYPTAPFFQHPFPPSQYSTWFKACEKESISLYIHIPFCSKLCYYCGCHTHITQKTDRIDQYIETLLKEAVLVEAHLPSSANIRHIHFGGGSPTILAPASFTHLMSSLRKIFNIDAEDLALEADPRQMSEARIATYAKNGVTRISLGVQDFNSDVLVNVNRPQPYASERLSRRQRLHP
jgi:oxygen-independent coproporphyrinogen-3 oxidase